MNKIKKWFHSTSFSDIAASIFAIIVGLLFGLIILLMTNASQAFPAFGKILMGGFSGGIKGMGDALYLATPLIMTGLSVGFAFKTGLFNIGASGQLIVGGFVAILIGVKGAALGSTQWLVALLAAMAAGALWAAIPGILKAFFNVHEVISSIMMNYIGMYLVNMLVVEYTYDKLKNQSMLISPTAELPKLGLDVITKNSGLNSGFLIAILFVIIIYIILNKTVFGYELIACGHNPDASRYAGIKARRNIVLAMVIAGALAGAAGALIYLAGAGKHIRVIDVLAAEGFLGIPVALLGMSNPIGVLFSAIFLGYIKMGGFYMQRFDFVPEIIDIMISAIIYFSAFALIAKNIIAFFVKKRKDRPNKKIEGAK
ncbi:MAG: ABC transporter permease [Eubacteriales bacterium]